MSDIYTDSEAEESSHHGETRNHNEPQSNDFVIVQCAGKKTLKHFVAVVEKKNVDYTDYQVVFLKKTGLTKFCIPEDRNIYDVEASDICKILDQPVSFRRNQYQFDFDFSAYNM